MKKRTIITIVAILIILAGMTGGAYAFIDLKKHLSTMQSNFQQVASDIPNKNLVLTKNEFRAYVEESNDILLKSLMDSMNIKWRHVVQTYDNRYHYSYDTTIHLNYDYTMPQTTFKRFEYRPDSCINVSGIIDWQNDSIDFEIFDVDIRSKVLYYKFRIGRKGNKTLWPFGKKEIHAVSINLCDGETTSTRITIEDN